jgi:hypothetical protein
MTPIEENINWIKSGKIGCTFAALFAKAPEKVGWKFVEAKHHLEIPKDAFMLSLVFPDKSRWYVEQWAIANGFYTEPTGHGCYGLRIKVGTSISWVQYFGPDSHVKTRQTPHPMLSFTIKLPARFYAKVGFNGILHLAHASVEGLAKKVTDALWNRSLERTQKEIGHKLGIEQAAKTTFLV